MSRLDGNKLSIVEVRDRSALIPRGGGEYSIFRDSDGDHVANLRFSRQAKLLPMSTIKAITDVLMAPDGEQWLVGGEDAYCIFAHADDGRKVLPAPRQHPVTSVVWNESTVAVVQEDQNSRASVHVFERYDSLPNSKKFDDRPSAAATAVKMAALKNEKIAVAIEDEIMILHGWEQIIARNRVPTGCGEITQMWEIGEGRLAWILLDRRRARLYYWNI